MVKNSMCNLLIARFNCLPGTYDDKLEWLKKYENSFKPTFIMSLGFSLGNFNCFEAAGFLSNFSRVLDFKRDLMLIGLDGCQDPERV